MDASVTPESPAVALPSSRRRWLRLALILGLVTVGLEQAWRHGHDYVFADKFAAVEPGKVYRGAWQQNWPMRRIVQNEQIKTIVALAHPPTHPLVIREQALASELGVKWLHVPIVDNRTLDDGEALFDRIEEAAAIVADPANQPVYFHCHHGINRASMVHIAYRILHCGWTLEQASDEVARTFGLVQVDKGPDYRIMDRFYQERVLPRRGAAAANPSDPATSTAAAGASSHAEPRLH